MQKKGRKQKIFSFFVMLSVALIAIGCGGGGGDSDLCVNVDCGTHGSCVDGNCICTDGYTGDQCETPPNTCAWTRLSMAGYEYETNKSLRFGAYYNGNLYATAGISSSEENGITGTLIEVWRYDEDSWTQINTDGFGDANNIYGDSAGMAVYNNKLYVGAKNSITGVEIWEWDGSVWTQVNVDGFGQGANNDKCQTMTVYNNLLYVGTGYGGYPDGIEVWAFDGINWTNTDIDDGGENEKIDFLIEYNDSLFLGTYNEGDGCEIWTYNGSDWSLNASGGFGDSNNIVGASMVVYNNHLYVATVNLVTGGEVWAYNGVNWAQVNPDGFGDPDNVIAVNLGTYDNNLYSGAGYLSGDRLLIDLWEYDGVNWVQSTILDNCGINITGGGIFNNTFYVGSEEDGIWMLE